MTRSKRYYLNSAKYYYYRHYIPCTNAGLDALAKLYEDTVWINLFVAAEAGEI